VTESTLKVNYFPYILEIIFLHEVDALKHKASVKDGVLIVSLYKKLDIQWDSLEAIGDKEVLLELKKEAIVKQNKLNEDLTLRRSEKRISEEKHAVRKQMALDEMERNRLENIKLDQKKEAEDDVYKTFSSLNQLNPQQKTEEKINYSQQNKNIVTTHTREEVDFSKKNIFNDIDQFLEDDDIDDGIQRSKSNLQDKNDNNYVEEQEVEEFQFIPPPRSSGLSTSSDAKVSIQFTPRLFPTPMRESKASEEEDWIAKNRRHLKKHAVMSKGLSGKGDFSEEDPVWLKAKGDDFFRLVALFSLLKLMLYN